MFVVYTTNLLRSFVGSCWIFCFAFVLFCFVLLDRVFSLFIVGFAVELQWQQFFACFSFDFCDP